MVQNSNRAFFLLLFSIFEIFPSRLISLTLLVSVFLNLGHLFEVSTSFLL